MITPDIFRHPFGFGMLHDGFATYPGQIIHLTDIPPFGRGEVPSASFVVQGTVPLPLFLGRNTNPDADLLDRFRVSTIFLHILLHTRKRWRLAREKCS